MTRCAFIKTDIVNLVGPRGLKTLGTASSNKMFLQLGARAGRIGDKQARNFLRSSPNLIPFG
jgi:hypothetical protein